MWGDFGSYLLNSSEVGLFLQADDGYLYDNVHYANIPYVSTGTGTTRPWEPKSAENQILLSSSVGKAYAYYPYNNKNASNTSIHLDVSRMDDVIYSSVISGFHDGNAEASFVLKQALSVIKVKLNKGSYSGTGAVTGCWVSGSSIGLTGTLDGRTGGLSDVTGGKVFCHKLHN